jgi:prevent-host-death family protein
MNEIGAFEAKNKLGFLLDRVEQGEEVVITRHGKPVARLVPNVGRWIKARAALCCNAFARARTSCKPRRLNAAGPPPIRLTGSLSSSGEIKGVRELRSGQLDHFSVDL